jgi:hypothetical protein
MCHDGARHPIPRAAQPACRSHDPGGEAEAFDRSAVSNVPSRGLENGDPLARIPVVVHRHLTLVWCDSAASLAEVLAQIDLTDVPHQRFGDRAIAVPIKQAEEIRDALWENGTFPRVVGDLLRHAHSEEEE